MKTKDIAYGGLMIAVFLILGLIFQTNNRIIQTYLEVIKTIVVTVFIRDSDKRIWWVFALACFLSCLFFVSILNTLIYDVPSIIGGCVIGLQQHNDKKIKNYVFYFTVHSIMMIYEFIIFDLLMQINLFIVYEEQFADVALIITDGIITKSFLEVFFILFIVLDSAFSSFIIFALSQITLKKMSRAKR